MSINVLKRKGSNKLKRHTRILKKLFISHRNKVISDDFEERKIQKKGRAYQKEGFSSFNEYFRFLMNHKKEMEDVKQKNGQNKR